ncbi:Wadjet anti-phage system protein JetD domain-containing protein [Kribbella sp. NPDC004536]|uniref:Wadjet anti-phage system protein JetD domain-containing protein n=1 Tax=Kribbella sp. NPDC004536 TaxID=3364106 RepID=UPI0036A3B012
MKAPDQVRRSIENRLDQKWASDLAGATVSWPYQFALGLGDVKKAELEAGWTARYQPFTRRWRDWAAERPVRLISPPRRVYTTLQDIPRHIEVADIDAAATIAGGEWPTRLARGRDRLARLRLRFPLLHGPDQLIRRADSCSNGDFELLLTVAEWFLTHRTQLSEGLTPRQVPIPGVHAKWLQRHTSLVLSLTGFESLGLLPRHPARIHFTYLDPAYRRTGKRLHDSASVGDNYSPAYQPTVVIISENKDTAINFPEVAGGISIEGNGFGGKTVASFPWILDASTIVYWGDIDAYGFEILNGYRSDGIPAISMLMDADTYATYEPFGTNTDAKGNPIEPSDPKPLPELTDAERTLYTRVVAADHQGHRRIEQERIPLAIAAAAVPAENRGRRHQPGEAAQGLTP